MLFKSPYTPRIRQQPPVTISMRLPPMSFKQQLLMQQLQLIFNNLTIIAMSCFFYIPENVSHYTRFPFNKSQIPPTHLSKTSLTETGGQNFSFIGAGLGAGLGFTS